MGDEMTQSARGARPDHAAEGIGTRGVFRSGARASLLAAGALAMTLFAGAASAQDGAETAAPAPDEAAQASAQDAAPGVSIELNKLEPADGACRAYLLIENARDAAFESLSLDLVVFDADGVVAKRLAVELAPLRANKTVVKVFGVDGLTCDGVGRLLLNGVLACADASGEREDCLDLIETASRETVPFGE